MRRLLNIGLLLVGLLYFGTFLSIPWPRPVVDTATAQPAPRYPADDPYAGEQQQQRLQGYAAERAAFLVLVRGFFFADGCHVFIQPGYAMLLSNDQWHLLSQDKVQDRDFDGLFRQAQRDGLASASEHPERCQFFHDHPEIVADLRRAAYGPHF